MDSGWYWGTIFWTITITSKCLHRLQFPPVISKIPFSSFLLFTRLHACFTVPWTWFRQSKFERSERYHDIMPYHWDWFLGCMCPGFWSCQGWAMRHLRGMYSQGLRLVATRGVAKLLGRSSYGNLSHWCVHIQPYTGIMQDSKSLRLQDLWSAMKVQLI